MANRASTSAAANRYGGSPRSSSPHSSPRSPGGRRRSGGRLRDEDSDEGLVQRNIWMPPKPRELREMVASRNLHWKDFDLWDVLGTGTFAIVRGVTLKGEEEAHRMALKTMKKAQLLETNQVEHVRAEMQIMRTLDNHFIVTLLGSFQDERRVFFLLEHCHAGEIYGRLRREGHLPNNQAKFYAAELVLALQYLHEQEVAVVYRDIKPENVLLDSLGHIKLCDFGFARRLKGDEVAYTVVGTPEYMAPEMIKAEGHGLPVDFWGLGVLLYEMLAGFPPFSAKSPFDTYQKILGLKIKYPRHFDVKVADLLRNLLHLSPTLRFGHMDCMMHIWFDYVDWMRLRDKGQKAPWRPRLNDPRDTELFEKVPPESQLDGFDDCLPITRNANKPFEKDF